MPEKGIPSAGIIKHLTNRTIHSAEQLKTKEYCKQLQMPVYVNEPIGLVQTRGFTDGYTVDMGIEN